MTQIEVVDHGSETQLQVSENLNSLAQCSEGKVGLFYVVLMLG